MVAMSIKVETIGRQNQSCFIGHKPHLTLYFSDDIPIQAQTGRGRDTYVCTYFEAEFFSSHFSLILPLMVKMLSRIHYLVIATFALCSGRSPPPSCELMALCPQHVL